MSRPHGCRCPPWRKNEQSGPCTRPRGAELDKHLFPEACLQDSWIDNHAKSAALGSEYRTVTDPDDGQKWQKWLIE